MMPLTRMHRKLKNKVSHVSIHKMVQKYKNHRIKNKKITEYQGCCNWSNCPCGCRSKAKHKYNRIKHEKHSRHKRHFKVHHYKKKTNKRIKSKRHKKHFKSAILMNADGLYDDSNFGKSGFNE